MAAATEQLVGMLELRADADAMMGRLQPFCRVASSCLLSYGFREGRFFAEWFDERDELEAFVSAFDPDDTLLRARRDALLSRYPPP